MRISDWSSDVCSSDLGAAQRRLAVLAQRGVDAGDLHAQLRGADGGVVAGGAGADDDDVELFAHFIRSQRNLGFGIRDWEGGVSAFAESPIPNPQSRDAARVYIPSSIRCGFSSWFLMYAKNSRSAEHTSVLQSLTSKSYAVFCLKKQKS